MTIYNLDTFRNSKIPHISGVAVCSACRHEWAAVAPVGDVWLKCPACVSNKARFQNPVLLEPGLERVECKCGCQVFSATREKLVCINCGDSTSRTINQIDVT